ncbi:MAG: DUF4838 domain-containing protein, partial [Victivallales bacterium]|nr:DUF4838 domain-containing protein [Victivallales bacterium]
HEQAIQMDISRQSPEGIKGVRDLRPAALVFVQGQTAPGGWKIKIDRQGGIITYGEAQVLGPALYDYIRLMNAFVFAPDCQKIPVQDSKLVLAAVDKEVAPRFHHFLNNTYWGIGWTVARTVDWYASYKPDSDHVFNTLLPLEKYRDAYPDYYMLQEDGKRQYATHGAYMSPCLSNEEASAIMEKRFLDMADGNDFASMLLLSIGDRPDFCHCEKCRANGNFYTDIMMRTTNRLARQIAAKYPEKKVAFLAYLLLTQPTRQVKPDPNVIVRYCASPSIMPCNVHVDCEENAKALAEIRKWSEIVGPERLGVMGYEEVRPWHHLKQLELFNRYAKANYYTYSCNSVFQDKQALYITGRWNLGDEPDKVISEFNNAYYGAAGEYITKIQRLIDNYCDNYVHQPGEVQSGYYSITVKPYVFERKTVLDRKTFDAVYLLLDKAFEAAKNDGEAVRKRLLFFKFYWMRTDLAKYRYTDCGGREETLAFIQRLKDFIKLCAEINSLKLEWPDAQFKTVLMHHTPARLYLQMVAGLNLPTTVADWTQEPELLNFLKAPEKSLVRNPISFPGGIEFKPELMRGGKGPIFYQHQCPRKYARILSRPSSGFAETSVTLSLDKKPTAPLLLVLEGLDDDKPGISTMSIKVNGKEIFSRANTFLEDNWSRMSFTIPTNTLNAGENLITVANTVQDKAEKAVDDGEVFIGQSGKQDYTWGWICLSRIYVLDPSGTFQEYLAGTEKPWRGHRGAKLKTDQGKVLLENKGDRVDFILAKEHRIGLKAGEAIRINARGSGNVAFGVDLVDVNDKYLRYGNQKFSLKPQGASATITLPAHSTAAVLIPSLTSGEGGAAIEDISFEIIRK